MVDQPVLAPFDGEIIVLEAQEPLFSIGQRASQRILYGGPPSDSRENQYLPLGEQRTACFVQQAGGIVGKIGDAVHVENEAVGVGRESHETAHDELSAVECQFALKAQAFDPRCNFSKTGRSQRRA